MTEPQTRIIGGKFGLAETFAPAGSTLPVLKSQRLCMLSGRCCLGLLAECLPLRRVWLPSYLCPTMVAPFQGRGLEIRFYAIGDDLTITQPSALRQADKDDLVIFIDYFGFPCPREHLAEVAGRGAWVLEDACQALLGEYLGRDAHFLLYSPRKFVGVPDGGILSYDDDIDLGPIALEKPPTQWWLRSFEAIIRRREWDRYGQDHSWFGLIQDVAATVPLGPYAMSELAQTLLFHSFDYAAIAQRRIDNYTFLQSQLPELSLLGELPAGVVPQGFPIRVADRDRLRRALCDEQIYPPIHWLFADVTPAEFTASHQLAAEILTLPCDQRYDRADMTRLAQTLRRLLKR